MKTSDNILKCTDGNSFSNSCRDTQRFGYHSHRLALLSLSGISLESESDQVSFLSWFSSSSSSLHPPSLFSSFCPLSLPHPSPPLTPPSFNFYSLLYLPGMEMIFFFFTFLNRYILIVFEVLISQASLVAHWWRICLPMPETQVQSLGWEAPLEKEMATHSSILAWRISWTEEPGGVCSPWGHKEPDTS